MPRIIRYGTGEEITGNSIVLTPGPWAGPMLTRFGLVSKAKKVLFFLGLGSIFL